MFYFNDSVDKALGTFNEVVARLEKITQDKKDEADTLNEEAQRLFRLKNKALDEAVRADNIANKIKALLEG